MGLTDFTAPLASDIFTQSPILLTGGVIAGLVNQIPSSASIAGMSVQGLATSLTSIGVPISLLLNPLGALNSLVIGNATGNPVDQQFATFNLIPGSSLVDYEVSQFPFFTQQMAANATVQQALKVSMLMFCPMTASNTLLVKLAVMSALTTTLKIHNNMGGLYNVVTPAQIYTDCILQRITDVTSAEYGQPQSAYQWDFLQPLVQFPNNIMSINNTYAGVINGGTNIPSPASMPSP